MTMMNNNKMDMW